MNITTIQIKDRLSLLRLAKKLGNVSKACEAIGTSRTMFYRYKRRYRQFGLTGLSDRPPVHNSHPLAKPEWVVDEVVRMSLLYPGRGYRKLSHMLLRRNIKISPPVVYRVLKDHQIGNQIERWILLEQQAAHDITQLTDEQIAFIERCNPCFRERLEIGNHPGERLAQDTSYLGCIKGVGKIYLYAVVDKYSNYLFSQIGACVYPSGTRAANLLVESVIPFYKARNFIIKSVQTDNGRDQRHFDFSTGDK